VAGKYLKQLFILHEKAGTLNIDKSQLSDLCNRCKLPEVCKQWGKENELTCFCLESII